MDSLRHLFPIAVFAAFCLSLSTGESKPASADTRSAASSSGPATQQRDDAGSARLASAASRSATDWVACARPSPWPRTVPAPQRCRVV